MKTAVHKKYIKEVILLVGTAAWAKLTFMAFNFNKLYIKWRD